MPASRGEFFVNNDGGTTRNVSDEQMVKVGRTRDNVDVYEQTFTSSGLERGCLCLEIGNRYHLVRWSGYTVQNGQKKPWNWSRAYDLMHVSGRSSDQLEKR